ncbi:ADP-ribosylglycohydrolase family protein [Cupriavidus basilensis]|uniref:ADP-ribosylglycohydrolase family protein n=1 Tax=Cupriavidus basilensis TaxID=68895 RepID=UPI0009E524A0|nr:ADP-ribosylglycohydrolase family protein [Cupriavidus basilensis]
MTNSENNGFAGLLLDYGNSVRVGGLVGLLVGDSLGVPWEFYSPENLPARDLIEMAVPEGFPHAHDVPNGTWSDDSSQSLCLLASLLDQGHLSLTDFADRLLRWYDEGYLAVDGHVFDIGLQTADALDRLRDGTSPLESGGNDERSNGNGSIMRVLPLALWHTGTDEALVRDAHLQSLPTHAHPRSQVCCAFYCLVARGYLHQLADPWSWADRRLEEIYNGFDGQERQVLVRELEVLRSFLRTEQARGTGYVLDCLATAKRSMEDGDSFEDVVKTAILFGHDTDTSAAVAGGLAGIRSGGIVALPVRWLEQLRGFELVEPLIARCK